MIDENAAAPLDEYSWTTTSTPDQEFAGLYLVQVTIAWPNGEYEQRTNLYRRPPQLTRRQR
jgi:hypothetical protein